MTNSVIIRKALKPTEEQTAIVNAYRETKESLKVRAFAGAGKTSTLKMIAKENPKDHFLYVAYNKAIQLDAEKSFPQNVVCKTAHSLAYSGMRIGQTPGFKSKLTIFNKAVDILKLLNYKDQEFNHFTFYIHLQAVINKFCQSDAQRIDKSIVDEVVTKEEMKKSLRENQYKKYHSHVLKYSKELWDMFTDENMVNVGITHDVYLKMFQLKGLVENNSVKIRGFDAVFVDEAQDLSPVMSSLIEHCIEGRKIYIGDSHQQIYAWRGAVDALNKLSGREEYLTQSFRFGHDIAELAYEVLKLKKETKVLRGTTLDCNIYKKSEEPENLTGKAILFRTNMGIIEKIIYDLDKNPALKVFVVGEIESMINMTKSAYFLSLNRREYVTDKKIKTFDNYDEFVKYADFDADASKINSIIKKYVTKTIDVLNAVKEATDGVRENQADYICSTIHKSKGLEWNTVELYKDIIDCSWSYALGKENDTYFVIKPFSPLCKETVEQANLLYVALTRAKKNLIIPDDLRIVIADNQRQGTYRFEAVCKPEEEATLLKENRIRYAEVFGTIDPKSLATIVP